ncbi:MAG: hypothetical protein JNN13_14630 [Planctomycetes bacterium]|nr:hypothetical protein [Planctomycetota bacterium]
MNRRALHRRLITGTLVLALVACDEPRPALGDETAAELRALRLALQQPATRPGPVTTERPAIDAAMAPLREALLGLLASQRQLEQQQLALAQEMQRWSQLLIASSNDQRAEEGKALAARLQALEQSLTAQDERHRQVESLMTGALDRTADRLEAFLKQLQALPAANAPGAAGAAPAPAPGSGGGPPDGRPDPDHTSTRSDPEATPARVDAATAMRRPWRWAWGALGALGLLAGVLFFRRWQRAEMPSRTAPNQSKPQVQASRSNRTDGASAYEPEPGRAPLPADGEPGVDEIWAAAALLGEAVGRLRQTAPTPGPSEPPEPPLAASAEGSPPTTAPADVVELDALDDLFVIEDEEPVAPSPPGPRSPSVAPAPTPSAPQFVRLRMPAMGERSRQAVLSRLQSDPRVLRQPAPKVVAVGGDVEITFALVPRLSPGERGHLEQAVRDDC